MKIDRLIRDSLERAIQGSIALPVFPDPPSVDPLPVSPTTNPLPVTGTASVDGEVRLYVNGQLQASAAVVNGATYSLKAVLDDGSSYITVTQWDGTSESIASPFQWVDYQSDGLPRHFTTDKTISADTVWTAGSVPASYILDGHLTINPGVKLILMPGVRLEFTAVGKNLVVQGELDIRGVQGNEVVITSNEQIGIGEWGGIDVTAGATWAGKITINYTEISHATRGIEFASGTNIVASTINNSVISRNEYGVYLFANSNPIINGSRIVNNNTGIYLFPNNGAYSQATIVDNSIYGNTTKNINMWSSGSSVASVVINTTIVATNNWWGTADLHEIESGIQHAGDRVSFPATLPLVDYSGYKSYEGGPPLNTNSLLVGPLSDMRRPLSSGLIYTVSGSLAVPAGETLTVPENTTLRFVEGSDRHFIIENTGTLVIREGATVQFGTAASELKVYGTLDVDGVPGNHAVLTSVKQKASNEWSGIKIYSGGNCTIENADIAYAYIGLSFEPGMSPSSVINSVIYQNTTGIKISGNASPMINSNHIIDNNEGISLFSTTGVAAANPQPTITGNSIYRNATKNLIVNAFINPNNAMVIATGNWWGSADLHEIESSIQHAGDRVSPSATLPLVDYSGYQSYEGGPSTNTDLLLVGPLSDTRKQLISGTTYTVSGSLVVPAGETLTVPENTTLRFVEGNARHLIIENTGTLVLEEGATLEFSIASELKVYGILDVNGAPGNHAMMTSVQRKAANEWSGIKIYPGGSSTIDNADIAYANNGIYFEAGINPSSVSHSLIYQNEQGIVIKGTSDLEINNNRIVNNTRGIYIDPVSGVYPHPVIVGNSIYGNLSSNLYVNTVTAAQYDPDVIIDITGNWWGTTNLYDIEATIVHNGEGGSSPVVNYANYQSHEGGATVNNDTVLIGPQSDARGALQAGVVYTVVGNLDVLANDTLTIPQNSIVEISGTLTVETGATLIINEGAILRFGNTTSKLEVDGALDVNGAVGNEVVFTSVAQTGPGDWSGIHINAGDSVSPATIENAIIEYASTGVFFNKTKTRASITNCLIHYNGIATTGNVSAGIRVDGDASPSISQNRIVNNLIAGIRLRGSGVNNPNPSITNNTITNNGSVANRDLYTELFYNSASVTIAVPGNWWGTANPSEIEGKIFHSVDASSLPTVDFSGAASSLVTPPYLATHTIDFNYISPISSSSVQDASHITGALSDPSDWTITVRDLTGNDVQTYTSVTATTIIDQFWDGTDTSNSPVIDGRYIVRITATANGHTGVVAIKEVWIDNTPPVADMTSPVNSATLQNLLTQLIAGTASDNLTFDHYVIEYEDDTNPGPLTSISLQPFTAQSFQNLGTWTIGTEVGDETVVVPNGDYTLYLTVRDKAGNESVDSVSIAIDNLAITQVDQSLTELDVAGTNTVDFEFSLNMPGTVTIKFYDERTGPEGPLAGSLTHDCITAGQCVVNWDGTFNDNPLPDGAYFFVIEAANGGRVGSYREYTTDYIPNTDIDGFFLLGNGTQTGTFNTFENDWLNVFYTLPPSASYPNNYARVILQVFTPGKPAVDVSNGGILTPPGASGTISWNGIFPDTGLPRNETIAYLTFWRPVSENIIVIRNSPASHSEPIISGQSAQLEIKADPYQVTLSYGQLSTLRYHLATFDGNPVDVTLKLLPPGVSQFDDPAAIPVFTQSLSPGDHTYEWDGLDSSDLENLTRTIQDDGVHIFAIKAGSTIYKGVISVYQ